MKNIFVIKVTYTQPLSEVEKYLEAHRNFLTDGYEKGALMMSGAQKHSVGSVIVGRFWSMDEAYAFIHADPLSVADVAKYEVVEFVPSRYADEIKDFICRE